MGLMLAIAMNSNHFEPALIDVEQLGLTDYIDVFEAMKTFTLARQSSTRDALWLTEHRPIFTQGQAGKVEHILKNSSIALVQSDRGGQVTYHGPGQIVLYFLIDIKRAGIGVRQMVSLIEATAIDTLGHYGIAALAKPEAPGVYVDGKKIASLGLRVRNGRCYHGVAINIDMDLAPFALINPCGYAGLEMTQLSTVVGGVIDKATVAQQLLACAQQRLLAVLLAK